MTGRRKKSTAYLLWLFGGLFGSHNFYNIEKKKAIIKIVLLASLPVCAVVNTGISATVFTIAGLALLVLWIADLPSLGKKVDRWNSILDTADEKTKEHITESDSKDQAEGGSGEAEDKNNAEEDGIWQNQAAGEGLEKTPSPAKTELKKAGKKIGANLGAAALTTALGPLRLITDPLLKAATGKTTQESPQLRQAR